ncbi:MAG: glycoside hydrolase family 66 protein [Faecalibacterium sp.]|jgi:dextranase|nr:glycoside hydrolase family 66 protein [Faecalibacterium sp.]
MISDFYPAQGTFLPGQQIVFRLENFCTADSADIYLFLPDGTCRTETHPLRPQGNCLALNQPLTVPSGYGAAAVLYRGTELIQTLYTAFDVMQPGKIIRYGFLSDFAPEDAADDSDITWLCQLHINTVQFYDWSYRHDCLVAPTPLYRDMMGKENSLPAIKKKIQACHACGMRATAYGAVYAASEHYHSEHPEQGLYNHQGTPLRFIDVFYLMNLAKGSGWFAHILEEYRRAVAQMGFDGIHMDTYGEPKCACDADGNAVWLDTQFTSLIDAAWETVQNEVEAPCMIFNHVGGWPLKSTEHARQSCTYIEVWPPNEHYWQLAALIAQAKLAGRPVVLAAYPSAFRTQDAAAAIEGERMLSFVAAMHGATQLCFGESRGVITQGYYADYTALAPESCRKIRNYQDFFVQYETLLYNDTLADVSLTHQGWDNREYTCDAAWSAWGEGGKLWLHIRENHNTKLICLANLTGGDDLWNSGRACPAVLENITLSFLTLVPVKTIWTASPDEEHGQRHTLLWREKQEADGLRCEITLPRLKRCGILVAEMEAEI